MPIEETYTLTSGTVVQLRAPDLYSLALGNVPLPSQARRDVLNLIAGAGGAATDAAQIEAGNLAWLRGLYEAAALVIVEPKLILRGPVAEGALAPSDLTLGDLADLYGFFRSGRVFRLPAIAADHEPGTSAEPASDSAGVPQSAE